MSRRPQILHVTDSVNSRTRNRTYTKNTVSPAVRKSCCDISDWETYCVMDRDDVGYATVNKKKTEEEPAKTPEPEAEIVEDDFTKENAQNERNINTEVADKVVCKKLDVELATETPRSGPEVVDENFTIENPLLRIKAIENNLEHIAKTNNIAKASEASADKAAAFDGLLQYLRDYRLGLRDLLVNNNVVIIEPVRGGKEDAVSKEAKPGGACRITGATVKAGPTSRPPPVASNAVHKHQPKIKRHFFYHPCNKVNRYLVDKELPDPDLVKNGREKYEEFLKLKIEKEIILSGIGSRENLTQNKAVEKEEATKKKLCRFLTVETIFRDKRWTDSGSLSSGISSDLSCYDTDLESPHFVHNASISSDDDEEDYSSMSSSKNLELEYRYVSPDVLEKIRACGETTTYYGGRIVASSKGQSPMTHIMKEIKEDGRERGGLLGVKFRLVKSNSCGSRLELAGADEEGDVRSPRSRKIERGEGKESPEQCSNVEEVFVANEKVLSQSLLKTSEKCQNVGKIIPPTEKVSKMQENLAKSFKPVENVKVVETVKIEAEKPKPPVIVKGTTSRKSSSERTIPISERPSKSIATVIQAMEAKHGGVATSNFLSASPAAPIAGTPRGRLAPKVLHPVDKPAPGGARGPRPAHCDMEFETFEVLDTSTSTEEEAVKNGDVDGGKEEETAGHVEGVKEAAPEVKVTMTSWASRPGTQTMTFDFRTNQSTC